jgi:hypothetical protein
MSDDPQPPVVVQSAADALGDPIPDAIAAIDARIVAGRAARLALTDRVAAVEGKAPVPGPRGPAGKDGLPGKDGSPGAASTVPGPAGSPGILGIQRTVATTDANGLFTWTFPTPYAAGITPVCSADVQDASADTITVKITAVSNTAVTVKATKPTMLGVVLSTSAAAQAKIHLTAMPPS